eukprot:4279270-Pyramimonas_sp.AAC.1
MYPLYTSEALGRLHLTKPPRQPCHPSRKPYRPPRRSYRSPRRGGAGRSAVGVPWPPSVRSGPRFLHRRLRRRAYV